jgi:hypothetical protein
MTEMVQGVNLVAVLAAAVLGLVDVVYVRIASGPSNLGPTPIALLFLTASALTSAGGAVLPWKRGRIGLLAATSVACFALGIITFWIGLGLILGALLAGGAVMLEFSKATDGDGTAALLGAAVGFAVFGLTWMIAVNSR